MNDTTRLEVRPEVADFLDKVRARLSDLSDDEREELLGGLEADISELVADGGSVAELGDPRAYADELRAAAGLERATPRRGLSVRRPRRSSRELLTELLDGSRGRFERWVSAGPARLQAWEVVQTLRPAWWVLRAWVAAQLVDSWTGPWEHATLIPRMGDDFTGLLVLLAAVVASVLVGLRKAWPASHSPGSLLARVVLLGLNTFAVLQLLIVVDDFPSASYLHEQAHPCAVGACGDTSGEGLVNDGQRVRNVFAYDADGNALEGVQLYDQNGRQLAVAHQWASRMRYGGRFPTLYPWSDAEGRRWNVYPLPLRTDNGWGVKDKAWTSENPPFLPQPPAIAVPPAFLPLPAEAEGPAVDAEGEAGADAEPRGEDPAAETGKRDGQER
jgi:hypothetical protein